MALRVSGEQPMTPGEALLTFSIVRLSNDFMVWLSRWGDLTLLFGSALSA
jgi:hypothetical protein